MPISTANEPAASQPRWKPHPKPRPTDPTPIPPDPRFLTTIDPAMRAALEPIDRLATDMEALWGIGRLIGLVSPDTAARFARAKHKLDLAIRAKSADDVAAKASVLSRGWNALDQEARALGHTPDDIDCWCVHHPVTQKNYAVVKHQTDVDAARRKHPDHTVLTLADLVASHMVTFRAQQLSSEPLPDDDIPF